MSIISQEKTTMFLEKYLRFQYEFLTPHHRFPTAMQSLRHISKMQVLQKVLLVAGCNYS